jgi:putative membrane protein
VIRVFTLVASGIVFAVALSPPLHHASQELFSAHMVQHLLLILIAPALFVLGLPEFRMPRWAGPISIVIAHAVALWAWHLPALYDAAIESTFLHLLEHLSFIATALAFWVLALGRGGGLDRLQRVGIVFVTALQSSALGALIAFASTPLYRAHLDTDATGLSPLEDQQLAGAIMWIPPGVVYLCVMLVLLYGWFAQLDRADQNLGIQER